MRFLAAAPWSDRDYENIREEVTSMGLKPSPDVAARLKPNHDVIDIFKDILLHVVIEEPPQKAVKCKIFMDTLQEIARTSPSTLMENWISISRRPQMGFYSSTTRALWIALTKALLQYGNAEELIQGLASCLIALTQDSLSRDLNDEVAEVVRQLFARAIEGGAKTMSILQHSTIAVAWAPLVAGRLDKDQDLGLAFAQISLPHLLQVWMSHTTDGGIDLWAASARLLLRFGDAKEVLQAFAVKSKDFAASISCSILRLKGIYRDILTELFLRLVPGKHPTFVPLSNAQRASLVEAWAPCLMSRRG